jgi:hypothetical protein
LITSLQVTGGRTPLYPDFDADRSRYSIVAASPTAVLSVTATSSDEAPVFVNGTMLSSGETAELVGIAPGTELVFTVGQEPDPVRYTVQYLPPNFPELRLTTSHPDASEEPLYTNLSYPGMQFVAKLDAAGVPLWYRGESQAVFDFKKHPGGSLSYAVRRSGGSGAHQVLLDSNFQEVSRLSTVGLVQTDIHDFLILPNGNRVFMSYEPAVHDLTAFGLAVDESVKDSIFQEVTPDQQVLFQWNSWDHMQYDHSVYAFNQRDYAHANSIALDHDEHWLWSSRGLSQVMKIHRTTGEVMWRLGGIASDFTFVNDPYNGFCGQHTASRLDNGHVLIFDNSRTCLPELQGSRPAQSRAVEYALDEVAMTAELVWSYERQDIFASSQGSAQRLSNGNTMICWGSGSDVLATEVTAAGDVVYELTARGENDARFMCYRARRFAD